MGIKLGKYFHFKGSEYEVLGTVTHSETLEEMVLYRSLQGEDRAWVHPVSMWNELVEHNGQRVKRFTHEDDFVTELPVGIHKYSPPEEKLNLFLYLFSGRESMFAKRWENVKKGIAGYVPVCSNEWGSACPKAGGGKMKCGDCPKRAEQKGICSD